MVLVVKHDWSEDKDMPDWPGPMILQAEQPSSHGFRYLKSHHNISIPAYETSCRR